jgi:ATP-dependent protease ClpP protease subunit
MQTVARTTVVAVAVGCISALSAFALLSTTNRGATAISPNPGAPATSQEVDYKHTKARVTYKAQTEWIDGEGPIDFAEIYIGGEINRDAVLLVKRAYDEIKAPNFSLDSFGGDVDAGLAIGRFLRNMGEPSSNVVVPREAKCASACIFILAGGGFRQVYGQLGIHRPFLDTPSRLMTTEDVKKAVMQTQEKLRAYFREMNISERLADDMMMIPSNQIRWLSPQEIESYGLNGVDPVIGEASVLKDAQKYGLSRIEYEKRWQRVGVCWSSEREIPGCVDKIMRGLQP